MGVIDRPEPLALEVLDALDAAASAGWAHVWPAHLAELLRVYRLAMARDAAEDVGQYEFFFR